MGKNLSEHDQMLDAVADAIVQVKDEGVRNALLLFIDRIYKFEVSENDFERMLAEIVKNNHKAEMPLRIIRCARRECETYLGSLVHYGPNFPEWLQARTAAVVDVNSTSVILDTDDFKVRKRCSRYVQYPLRMNHRKFLERMDRGAIWVPSSQEVIELRRQAIRAEMGDNLQRIASLLTENDALQRELEIIDADI